MNVVESCRPVEAVEKLRQRILRNLAARYCMRLDELCLRLGEPEAKVRAELENLIMSGDVERIRPFGYDKSDLDVYAIPRPCGYPWEA